MARYSCSVCAIVKDEAPYLDEWIEWHLNAGVDHLYLYDNVSSVPVVDSVRSDLLKDCSVELFPQQDQNPQLSCYAKFLHDHGADSEWVAFIDADEFIRVTDGTPLPAFLEPYRPYDALYVGWLVYNADGQERQSAAPVRERFHKTVPYPPFLPAGKSIIRPDRVTRMGVHMPCPVMYFDNNTVTPDFERLYCPHGAHPRTDKIVIDHYFTKSWEEWQKKIRRGCADNSDFRKMNEFFDYNPDLIYLREP